MEANKNQKKTIIHQQIPVDDNGNPTLNKAQVDILHDYVDFVLPEDCILITTPANISVHGRGYNIIPIHDKKYSRDELLDIINLYNGQQALRKGLRIGVAANDRGPVEKFIHREFNKPAKTHRGKHLIRFAYKNGDTVEWVRPIDNNKGKRFDILYIESSTDEDAIERILLPMVYEGAVRYFDFTGKA